MWQAISKGKNKIIYKRENHISYVTITGLIYAEYLNMFIKYLDKFIGEKNVLVERLSHGTLWVLRKII